ncbi:hypothetical protein N7448_008517 [Penicillium atrosanguineum]|uniref:Protein kinase domain-containing protein n=1 Tax=Penicillium atrosanguineum TaxID=1132637 RepID=A0A9W9GRB6_9EURO|nr:hypothetical protein N7448_008517 [Penicillium atrosanguineum]KAJ5147947.1 hypothetical protein N7526_001299 [Penicillium atrosanguineum]KAJ5330758.1 hypothetical protein N7476_000541 [Penicillium atrosanguineum]
MRDQESAERFKLNVTVLSEDRSREVHFRPDPHQPGKQSREVIMWHRTLKLADNVHVYESPVGELRVVKQVSKKDSRLAKSASELDVLGQVSSSMELQDKQLFVHFHGWFPSTDYICLMMEYCTFGDISECFPSPLPEVETRCICEQLLESLAVLHGLGITHRDIKPQNVLVVQRDPIRVKIADFGISKRALEGQTELRTQIGTQGYMAPEILGLVDEAKEDSTYTCAVDIWSLGCLLFYLLTKQTPFSEYESLRDYVKGYTTFPDTHLIENSTSPSVQNFINRLLAPSPEDRPEASVDLVVDWVIEQDGISLPKLTSTMEAPKDMETHHYEAQNTIVDDQASFVSDPPVPPVAVQPPGDLAVIRDPDVEEEMNFYSYELWHVIKSTKSKTAGANRLLPILDQGANPSILHEGYNALHLSAEYGSAEWVELLLTYAADVKKCTRPRRETALHLATCQRDLETYLEKFVLLQSHGVELDAQNNDGDTALHLVIARFGSIKPIEALLAAGASTEKKGRRGHTPLMYAIYLDREEKALALLKGGANVNCEDENGRTPLQLAIASDRIGIGLIRQIISAGADINKADEDGHMPLYHAVQLKKRDIVYLLLDHDATCELGDSRLQRSLTQMQMWRRLSQQNEVPRGDTEHAINVFQWNFLGLSHNEPD